MRRTWIGLLAVVTAISAVAAAAAFPAAPPSPAPATVTKIPHALPVAPGDTLTVAFSATRDSLYKVIPGLRVVIVKQGSGFLLFRIWRRDAATKVLKSIMVDSVFTTSDSARFDLRMAKTPCESSFVRLAFRGDTGLSQPWLLDTTCAAYHAKP